MPVRVMLYDALEYTKQIKEISARNKKAKNWTSSEEFLSGLRKTDRLMPMITYIFYHGSKPYGGCRDLHGMLKLNNINEEYLQWIPNYKMNLVTLNDIDENKLQTGLRELIGTMKRSGNKQELLAYMQENEERFSRLDRETFDTIGIMLNQRDLLSYSEKNRGEGVYNMCQAIKEIREEGITEGIEYSN